MISLVIPWRDRPQLTSTIANLQLTADAHCGDLTVVNYGGDRVVLDAILAGTSAAVVDVPGQAFFNKASASNLGAEATNQEFLFFGDCDICLMPDELEDLLSAVRRDPQSFGTFDRVRETDPSTARRSGLLDIEYSLSLSVRGGRSAVLRDSEIHLVTGERHAPGLLVVRREHFNAIGGFNASLDGWGWEDQDIAARLSLSLGLTHLRRGVTTHVSHSEESRGAAHIDHHRWPSRVRMILDALGRYDVGDFAGTLLDDRLLLVPELRHDRLPERIASGVAGVSSAAEGYASGA